MVIGIDPFEHRLLKLNVLWQGAAVFEHAFFHVRQGRCQMQDAFADARELFCCTIEIGKAFCCKADPLIMWVKHLMVGPTDNGSDGDDPSVIRKVMFNLVRNREKPVAMCNSHIACGRAGDRDVALEDLPSSDGDELRADVVKFLRWTFIRPDELHAHTIPIKVPELSWGGLRSQCVDIVIFYAILASENSLLFESHRLDYSYEITVGLIPWVDVLIVEGTNHATIPT